MDIIGEAASWNPSCPHRAIARAGIGEACPIFNIIRVIRSSGAIPSKKSYNV